MTVAPAPPGRIVLRPVGSPLPLGFLALAVGTVILATLQLGWVPGTEGRAVALSVIAFVVPLQLVASVLGFIARDPAVGTGMGILSGTWLAIGLVTLTDPPGARSPALAVLLVVAAVALLAPATAAAGGKLVPAAVIALSAVRFALTGVVQAGVRLDALAGWTGLALGALATYAALALLLEDAWGRRVLPVGRRDGPSPVLAGEAGVRPQL